MDNSYNNGTFLIIPDSEPIVEMAAFKGTKILQNQQKFIQIICTKSIRVNNRAAYWDSLTRFSRLSNEFNGLIKPLPSRACCLTAAFVFMYIFH